jgi:hypothetical protein
MSGCHVLFQAAVVMASYKSGPVTTGQWGPVERSVGSGPHVTCLFLLQVSLFYRPLHSRSLVSHFSYSGVSKVFDLRYFGPLDPLFNTAWQKPQEFNSI